MCLSLDDKKHKLNHLDFLYLTTIKKKRMCQHDTMTPLSCTNFMKKGDEFQNRTKK